MKLVYFIVIFCMPNFELHYSFTSTRCSQLVCVQYFQTDPIEDDTDKYASNARNIMLNANIFIQYWSESLLLNYIHVLTTFISLVQKILTLNFLVHRV